MVDFNRLCDFPQLVRLSLRFVLIFIRLYFGSLNAKNNIGFSQSYAAEFSKRVLVGVGNTAPIGETIGFECQIGRVKEQLAILPASEKGVDHAFPCFHVSSGPSLSNY
jgi:hypothetical protein